MPHDETAIPRSATAVSLAGVGTIALSAITAVKTIANACPPEHVMTAVVPAIIALFTIGAICLWAGPRLASRRGLSKHLVE
ncbi:hypothetical protein [Microbacterium sp. NPDC089186]|uniref:hypothetical protein n=1 Tax=Microbacterium sp. NPDC089186 TaxID=3154969 RepID=UPI00342E73A3